MVWITSNELICCLILTNLTVFGLSKGFGYERCHSAFVVYFLLFFDDITFSGNNKYSVWVFPFLSVRISSGEWLH